MRTQFSTLFSLFVLALTFSACTQCGKDKDAGELPKLIKGMTLVGTITSGKGSFENNKGYSFSTNFETNHQFQSVNANNAIESKGEYVYDVMSKDSAHLALTDMSGLHGEERIEVTLKFTSAHSGTYVAKLLSSEQGEHSGTFELR